MAGLRTLGCGMEGASSSAVSAGANGEEQRSLEFNDGACPDRVMKSHFSLKDIICIL
jgi:hypothetical protein